MITLYIVDWRIVVVEWGKLPTPSKKGGGIVREGKCPGEYVQGEMSGSLLESLLYRLQSLE